MNAINECCICDNPFVETAENPGCICDECRAKMKDEPKPEVLPDRPTRFYRIK